MEDSEYRTEFRHQKQRTKFLNDLDGIGSKGSEVLKIFTTNKPEAFEDKTGAIFRAERVDSFIEIGLPDKEAAFGMICSMVPEDRRDGEFDADAFWEYCGEYTLAWISGAVKFASIAAVDRTLVPKAKISQQDIIDALVYQRQTHGRYLNARANDELNPAERLSEALVEVLSPMIGHRTTEALTSRVYGTSDIGDIEFHDVAERGENLIDA
jgi:ATP-dependent 26S proteasome regulatory subunit